MIVLMMGDGRDIGLLKPASRTDSEGKSLCECFNILYLSLFSLSMNKIFVVRLFIALTLISLFCFRLKKKRITGLIMNLYFFCLSATSSTVSERHGFSNPRGSGRRVRVRVRIPVPASFKKSPRTLKTDENWMRYC